MKQAGAIGAGVFAGNMLSAAVLAPRGSNQDVQTEKPVDPCAKELKNFIDCSRNVNDLSLCEGFNEALKACRREYGRRFCIATVHIFHFTQSHFNHFFCLNHFFK